MGRVHEAGNFTPQQLPGLSGLSRSTRARGSWSSELWAQGSPVAQSTMQLGVSRALTLLHLKLVFPARSPVP